MSEVRTKLDPELVGPKEVLVVSEVRTKLAPEPVGPYSQAIQQGRLVFLSGQIALDPSTNTLVSGGIESQTTQVLDNLAEVCRAADASLDDVVRLGIYLVDLAHFDVVNKAMAARFARPFPARSTVQVAGLPLGALVEFDAIIILPA